MIIAAVATELMKLRRSLVLLVTLAAPLCVTAFAAIALATRHGPVRWERFLDEGLAMWSFFMLPMSVTALTTLLAQLEHGSRMWNHLLTLPCRRSTLFGAKAIVAAALTLVMQVFVYVGLYGVGFAVSAAMSARALSGDRQFDDMAVGMIAMAVGALPMILLQLWVALRWRSFVVPLVIGILGTFFALVITAAGINLYIPWLLQIYATMWPKPAGLIGVQAGALGGMLILLVMLWDLGRDSAADRYQR
jgi:ABC-2 type transport system permease protein